MADARIEERKGKGEEERRGEEGRGWVKEFKAFYSFFPATPNFCLFPATSLPRSKKRVITKRFHKDIYKDIYKDFIMLLDLSVGFTSLRGFISIKYPIRITHVLTHGS